MQKSSTTRSARIRGASSERRQKQKQELRGSILRAASDEFLEHGYENFSLRRVAERIGYSPTTIYLYFQNKDELLLETVQEGFNHFDQQMKAAADETAEPLQRIEALGRAYINFGIQNPALYRLMFMQRSDFYFMPRFDEDDVAAGSNVPTKTTQVVAQQMLVKAVEDGITTGQLRRGDAVLMADVLWAGAHGLVSLVNSPLMSPEHAEQVIEHLLQTLINGIRA
jgi:AcrR family transcriptional regulator